MGFCSEGLKNEFETAMVNEPSVFGKLKFYCISYGTTPLSAYCYARDSNIIFLMLRNLIVFLFSYLFIFSFLMDLLPYRIYLVDGRYLALEHS